MKSITIHNLESDIALHVEQLAKEMGLSQSQLVKRLLRRSLGFDQRSSSPNDFERFCGISTKEDATAFEQNTVVLEQIDKELRHQKISNL